MQPVLFDSEEWAQIIAERGETEEPDTLDETCPDEEEYYETVQRKEIEALLNKAEQGDPIAQYELGECYEYGKGCTADFNEAYKWWLKAAKQGHKSAISGILQNDDPLPLHVGLLKSEKIDYFEFYLDWCIDINGKDGFERTPLLLAIELGNCEVCRFLLEAGADVHASVPASNDSQLTAFDLVMRDWNREIADMLLDAGADMRAVDHNGNTPLHCAAMYPVDIEVLECLLAHGAQTDVRNKQGKLPVDVAETEKKKVLLREAESKRAENIKIPSSKPKEPFFTMPCYYPDRPISPTDQENDNVHITPLPE